MKHRRPSECHTSCCPCSRPDLRYCVVLYHAVYCLKTIDVVGAQDYHAYMHTKTVGGDTGRIIVQNRSGISVKNTLLLHDQMESPSVYSNQEFCASAPGLPTLRRVHFGMENFRCNSRGAEQRCEDHNDVAYTHPAADNTSQTSQAVSETRGTNGHSSTVQNGTVQQTVPVQYSQCRRNRYRHCSNARGYTM